MKLWTLSLLAAAVSLQAAVDPALLGLVMPEAKVIAGVRVGQAQASPFGQFLLSRVNISAQRDKLIQATGFDPLRDLEEVVVASTVVGNRGLVIGKGVFQPARVNAAVALAGGQASTYKGLQILGGGNGPNASLTFLDASTIAIGDIGELHALIDRRATAGPYNGNLAQSIRDTSGNFDAWFVADASAAAAGARMQGSTELPSRMMQNVKQISGGIRFGATSINVTADALTASVQDAQALVDVLRFMAAMVDNDPKASSILKSVQFAAQGSTTHISLELPEEEAEALFLNTGARKPLRRGSIR